MLSLFIIIFDYLDCLSFYRKYGHLQQKSTIVRRKRDLDPLKEYEKLKSKLDDEEKKKTEEQNKKIAYAMNIPPIGSGENVKIKVMDYIEGM